VATSDLDDFWVTAHLEVEGAVKLLAPIVNRCHVIVLDVATVFAKVNGDLVGAGPKNRFRGASDGRIALPALLTQSCHMIDVDP
jgi:hypothetical protein